ncbi:YgcG family protein [Myxosarcina sp. GI1]|uniref:TPM domain-containing protein n=1 Tax=Myxosarcina sp. GI1 TaxID=1541065 RepID=UPI0009DF808C|nr:TPM domain-containing protein [Myxosarcina sp. GI1]
MLKHIFSLGFISSSILFSSLTGQAITVDEVPSPRQTSGGWVTDMADILSSETENKLDQLISQQERTDGTEIAVVTVPETAPAASPEDFATELFNYWGIGKAESNNGVLLLISYGENRVEIETGYGIEAILPDERVSNIIDTKIIPQYKQNDFDRGTLDGTQALVKALDSEVFNDNKWYWSIFTIVGSGLTLIVGGIVWHQKRRNKIFVKPNQNISLHRIDNQDVHCAKCHQPMVRVKTIRLTKAQQVAQKLGGVSYRGFQCPRCSLDIQAYSIIAYCSDSNRYDTCPKCQELTVTTTGEVLEAATRHSQGKFLSKKQCHCCNYQTEQVTMIPRVSSSNKRNRNNTNIFLANQFYDSGSSGGGFDGGGSSGSGFGGGSSDGGGAGGSW